MTIVELGKRFVEIINQAGGRTKSKSGMLKIELDPFEGFWYASLGTYDIGDWPSWTQLEARSHDDLLQKISKTIDDAEVVVREDS